MASHSLTKPSWDSLPDTFVTSSVSESDFLDRAHDMRLLSLVEQNVQLFYLSKIWELKQIIDQLLQQYPTHPSLTKIRNELNSTMDKARETWRKDQLTRSRTDTQNSRSKRQRTEPQ